MIGIFHQEIPTARAVFLLFGIANAGFGMTCEMRDSG